MPPEHGIAFGGGTSQTTLDPPALIALIAAGVLLFVLPRKNAIIPFLLITFLIPIGNSVVIGGAHFFISRIVALLALARLLMGSKEPDGFLAGGLTNIDRAFFWCTVLQAVAVVLLFRDAPAIVNQIGLLLDSIGSYCVLRTLVRTREDIYRCLKCLALISFVLGVCMVVEQAARTNLFSYLGSAQATPEIRDGKIRAQAAFSHPLLAGTFGATLLPLFFLLWKTAKAKVIALIGMVGATLMALTANSSSPILAYAGGILAVALWPLRGKMRMVRWGLLAALLGTAAVMKAPVWFLIAHIDLTGSSSGYHRAELIDQFVNHFSDWWLIGVKDTGSWGWDLWDAQNQYVNVGETGGLAAFVLFIVMIVRCFGSLGSARNIVAGDRVQEWGLWLPGAALFSHLVAFFGVNYFDQSKVNWFALLAIISAITAPILRSTAALETANNLPTNLSEPVRVLHPASAWWSGASKYPRHSR